MPDIRPFRGLSYDAHRVDGFAKVVAEPYDKVDEKMRAAYLEASPWNIVRVDLPREEIDGRDRYKSAGLVFRDWIEKGIVHRAERPAVYVYEQGFTHPDGRRMFRRAFIGLVEARPHERGHVLPHERTFAEPKADRMALLEAARAHFGMCFLLYRSGADVATTLAAAAASAMPVAAFALPDGTTHRVTPVEDPALIASLRRGFAGQTCYIADGHHRYETQIAFRRDHEKAGDIRPAHRYRLAAFVAADDPGLSILPTHRLLPKEISVERFVEAARPWLSELTVTPATLDRARFTIVGAGGRTAYLAPNPGLDLAKELPDLPAPVRKLDVTILHKLVLERGLGIEAGSKEHSLGYVRHAKDGEAQVARGERGCMALLKPTSVEDVFDVADAGAVMPQKSTDFYPKLLTGLVMNDIEDDLHG